MNAPLYEISQKLQNANDSTRAALEEERLGLIQQQIKQAKREMKDIEGKIAQTNQFYRADPDIIEHQDLENLNSLLEVEKKKIEYYKNLFNNSEVQIGKNLVNALESTSKVLQNITKFKELNSLEGYGDAIHLAVEERVRINDLINGTEQWYNSSSQDIPQEQQKSIEQLGRPLN